MSFTLQHTITLGNRKTVRIPEMLFDAGTLKSGVKVDIIYGKNAKAVVIVPHGITLQVDQQERIRKITDNDLEK